VAAGAPGPLLQLQRLRGAAAEEAAAVAAEAGAALPLAQGRAARSAHLLQAMQPLLQLQRRPWVRARVLLLTTPPLPLLAAAPAVSGGPLL
jgi:hypothetical protein